MTRTRLKCRSLLVFCVFVGVFRLSLANNISIESIDDLTTSFPVARGTECVLPFIDSHLLFNSSDQSIVLQLCGYCPICTNYGIKAGHLLISQEDTTTQSNTTTCTSFTLQQLRDGLVIFQHYYSAGLETVPFNLTVSRYQGGVEFSNDLIELYAQPFPGNFTLLTDPFFLLKEKEEIFVDSRYLSFTTNFQDQGSNLSYRVLNYTLFGTIQVLESSNWVSINQRSQKPNGTFTQSEIDTNKIRYSQMIPLNGRNVTDKLILQVYSFQLNGPNITCTFIILSLNSLPIKPQQPNTITKVNVTLTEGKQTYIDGHLFSLSFPSLNIQVESLINFPLSHKQFSFIVTITKIPKHGMLHLKDTTTPLTVNSVFNYTDLLANRLIYTHDDSDTLTDTAMLSISIESVTSQALLIPDNFTITTLVRFNILPVNDNSPRLIQHLSISPLEGSYITLNSSYFDIIDSDNQNYDYVIQVDDQVEKTSGHFARQNLGVKLSRFNMSQLRAKEILYTFQHLRASEVLNYYHNITIFDGVHTVRQKLYVSVIPMPISVSLQSNNFCQLTLDVLERGSSLPLSKSLFNIKLAAMERISEVIINVVKRPSLATLMLANNNNITSFSYPDLTDVLYNLTNSLTQETNDTFSLQFRIGHGSSKIINISLCIDPLPYPEIVNHTHFTVPSKGGKVITSSILHTTQSGDYNPHSIVYTITHSPRYGIITNSTTTQQVSSFTQEDIDLERIYYSNIKVHEYEFTEYDDSFEFIVRNTHYLLPGTYTMNIKIKHSVLNVTNKGLHVIEGGTHRINKTEFSIEKLPGYNMYVYITQFPMHGNLTLARPEPSPPIRHPPTFDLGDLNEEYLSYTHLGAEEISDHFTFLIVATNETSHHTFYGQFMIYVSMTNDNRPREIISGTTIRIPEGGTKAITTDYIKYSDDDYGFDSGDLKYIITFAASDGGQFCLKNVCNIKEWYQRDMYGDLYYKALSSNKNKYYHFYDVSDGVHTLYHKVFFIAIVEIEAHRNSSEVLVVDENSFVNLNSNNVNYAAVDNSGMIETHEMVYAITQGPNNGRLYRVGNNNNNITSFTQSDINSGLIIYQQDGSNTLNDSFNYNLEIRTSFNATGTIKISINPIDDEYPVLNINDKVLFVVSGSVVHISSSILSIIDTDTRDPAKLMYHVQSTSAGKLMKRSSHDSIYYRTTSFTQYDINKKLVRYKHDLLTSWSDYIYLNISDSSNYQKTTYKLRVIAVSGTIIRTSTGTIRLREGSNVTISSSKLTIHHQYFSTIAKGSGSLVRPVSHGRLLLKGNECNECVFSLDDIKRGHLMYVHDGSETTSDQLTFIIRWGSFNTGQLTLPIIIDPVNDEPPRIINNTVLVIYASSNSTVTSQYLDTSDIDTPPSHIKYKFNMTPSQKRLGHFVVNGTQSDQFTQADINNGLVVFVDRHDYDGFLSKLSFTVTDGIVIVSSNFSYRPEVVRLSMLVNNSLKVIMNGSSFINSNVLSATTNKDIDASSIQYALNLTSMKYGHVVVNGAKYNNSRLIISQSQIDSGLVLYQHTKGEYWEPLDIIHVVVFHPLALGVVNIRLQVQIQLLKTDNSQFAIKKTLSLEENNIICLNRTLLDARNIRYYTWLKLNDPYVDLHNLSLVFRVTTSPVHGVLMYEMNETNTITSFTEGQLVAGQICYNNNGHESDSDSFSIQVMVYTPTGLRINVTSSESIHISIKLYNDEKPYLYSPLPLKKYFVKGFRDFITSDDISVRDSDNNPDDIYFTVTESPTNGILVLNGSNTPILSFSQAQINNRQLSFIPEQLGIATFVFYFNDGYFNSSQSYTFTIEVEELSLNVSHSDLKLEQFESSAIITTLVLNSTTNGNSSNTYFTIIQNPQHGRLLVADKLSDQFTENDIKNNLVQYKLTDQRQYHDELRLNVSNFNTSTEINLTVVVVVKGHVNNSIVLKLNHSQPLPPYLLDLSDDSLRINLTSPLKYGYISFKYPHTKLGTNPETSFRYSLLKKGMVYYTWSPNGLYTKSSEGVYMENLKGVVVLKNGMSPGQFDITLTLMPFILPTPNTTTSTSIPTTMQPSTEPGTVSTSSSENNGLTASFYIPLVGLLIVVLLLLVIVIAFCFYQSKVIKTKLQKGFVPPSSSLSQKLPSNVYYSPPPPLTSGNGPIHDDSDTESSISGADIMMVQNIPHQTHPMMTISASQSHIPYPPHEPSYHHSMSGILNEVPQSESISYSPQLRHLQSPHSTNAYFPSRDFTRGIDIRSSSPTRKPSPTRTRNVRPYASLTRVNIGRASPVKRDYPPVTHFPPPPPRPESSSSLGYDSSCLTEERHSRPSSVMTPIRTEARTVQDEVMYTTTNRPALKTPQYWV